MNNNITITDKKIAEFSAKPRTGIVKTKIAGLKQRHQWFFDIVKKYKDHGSVLDVGGREGFLADFFKKDGHYCPVVIDISSKAVAYAKRRGHRAFVKNAHDLIMLGNRFDIILLSHCLEHCEKPELVIDGCKLILKPDGIVAVQIPLQKKERTPTKFGHYTCFSTPQELFDMFEGFTLLHSERDATVNLAAIFSKE